MEPTIQGMEKAEFLWLYCRAVLLAGGAAAVAAFLGLLATGELGPHGFLRPWR